MFRYLLPVVKHILDFVESFPFRLWQQWTNGEYKAKSTADSEDPESSVDTVRRGHFAEESRKYYTLKDKISYDIIIIVM